jgi:NAD(P)H-dependent FMN reductase
MSAAPTDTALTDTATSTVTTAAASTPNTPDRLGADPLRIAVIIGSTRDGRFGPTVADWFIARATEGLGGDGQPTDTDIDTDIDLIDLAEADLPLTMTAFGQPRPDPVAALAPRLAAADAFVIVTPEYNHSFPAALKSAIDWYHDEWSRKPVAFISYGGISGGLRAVQQLRHVFIELSAVPIRDTVSFHEYWNEVGADRSWPQPSEARDTAVRTLLDQLTWAGRTLRTGRREIVSSTV